MNQFLAWQVWESVTDGVFTLIGATVIFVTLSRLRKKKYSCWDEVPGFCAFGIIVTLLISFVIIGCSISKIVKVKIAPKIVLIDYIKTLGK